MDEFQARLYGVKKITILLPTRERLHGVLRVLDSIVNTVDPDILKLKLVNVLLKFDEDDIETRQAWLDYDYPFTRTYTWGRGRGYLDLYKYNNILAKQADSDTYWYLIMNDDAYFTKKNWNQELRTPYDQNRLQDATIISEAFKPVIYLDKAQLFPCINTWAYRAMGTITKANHADTYLKMAGEQAGCLEETDLGILHEAHKFEDKVRREGQAVYGQEWEEQKKFIGEDVEKLRKAIDSRRS